MAFENHDCIWDTHRFGIDPCIHVFENLPRKLTVRLLCSNIPPSILGHNVSGKKSLVRDPTCIKRYKSPSVFQGAVSEMNTMLGVLIIQVMQNFESYQSSSHAADRFRTLSNRSRNNGKTCSSLRKGITTLNSGWSIALTNGIFYDSKRTYQQHKVLTSNCDAVTPLHDL